MEKYGQMSKLSIASIAFTFLLVAVLLGLLSYAETLPWISRWPMISLYVLFAILTLLGLAYCPFEVSIGDGKFTVNFPIRKKSIQLNDIARAYVNDDKELFPMFGSYMFFGWWGYYKSKKYGKFFLLASNIDELVVLEMKNGKKYMISATDPAEIVARLNKHLS